MTVLAAMVMFALFLTAPGPTGASPDTLYEWGVRAERPPPCRPASDAERWTRDIYPQGKAATYHLRGAFYCETDIFRYGERPSFYDFATRHSDARIREVVERMGRDIPDQTVVAIETTDDRYDAQLSQYVRHAMEVALTEVLGPGRVARHGGDPTLHQVKVHIHRVIDPQLFLDVQLRLAGGQLGGEERAWRVY